MDPLIEVIEGEETCWWPATDIYEAARIAIETAQKQGGNVNLLFNHVVVTVAPGSNVDEVYWNYHRLIRYKGSSNN
jgi:hypothetical protein